MDNAGKIKDMRNWICICLIYAIIASFYGLDTTSVDIFPSSRVGKFGTKTPF